MVNAAEFKKYIGNAALYLDIDRSRNRTFLRRNVTQSLEHNQRALDAPETSMWNDHGNKSSWEFPTREALDLLARRSQPLLKLDIKSLLPNKPAEASRNSAASETTAILFTAKCRIDLKIWLVVGKTKEMLRVEPRRATLQARRTELGQKVFDVSMEEPFFVKLDELFVNLPRGSNESTYKRTIASAYTLAAVFSFPDPEDAEAVISILNSGKYELPKSLSEVQTCAKGRWLPKCPSGHLRLSMIMKNGEHRELDYMVDAELGWQTNTETRLQTYNRVLRSAQATRESQKTPPTSTVRPSDKKKVQLTYLFKGPITAKSLSLEGCLCIFCHRRDFHTLERLDHHIKAEHDMLRCKVEEEETARRDNNIVNVSIEVSISDRYSDARASNNVADARDIDWVAPKRPFNMAQYLAGDESWIAEGQNLKRKPHASKTSTVAATLNRVQPKRPSEVLDLPEPRRRKYKVPKPNGVVRFFRTDSKRMLEEGEYLSESDDETNEAWLKLRCNQATQQVDANVSQKTFMMIWGDHMLDEQLSGDIHLGDAVVRFVRKHLSTLQRPDQSTEFTKKMEELREDEIVSQEVLDACKDALVHGLKAVALDPELAPKSNHVCTALRESSTRGNIASSKTTHKPQSGGRGGQPSHVEVGVNENGEKGGSGRTSHSLATDEVVVESTVQDKDGDIEMMDEPGHEKSITRPPLWEEAPEEPSVAIQTGCTCGKVVDDNRTAICCADLDCRRQEFHLKCVRLNRRVPGWKCSDCR